MAVKVIGHTVITTRPISDTITAEELAERWRATGSPFRITDTEKQIYERFLLESTGHIDAPKMVVLGVTPEFRELGHKHGYQVTCVDFSQTWIDAMEILMDGKGGADTIVRCNWLEIPLQRGEYDVVVGDGSLNLVGLKNRERLLEIVHSLLKPTGYFICRMPIGIGEPIPLGEALEMYGERLLRYPERYIASLWFATRTPQNQMGNIYLIEGLEKLRDNGDITSDEFDTICNRLSKVLHIVAIGACALEQKQHERLVSKYFQIKGIDYDKLLNDVEKPMGMLYVYCLANKDLARRASEYELR